LNLARVLILIQLFLAFVKVGYNFVLSKPIKGEDLRPDPIKDFEFLKVKALRRFFLTVLTFCNIKGKNKKIILSLIPIIQRHWKDSGVIWITKYYGEVFRLILSYLNGKKVLIDNALWIKKTRSHLPMILSKEIRDLIVKFKHSNVEVQKELLQMLKCLLSCLNFYRACSGHHKVKLNSITDLHKGVIKSLDFKTLANVRKSMGIPKIFGLPSPSYFIPPKAGVNANIVYASIGYDFIALMLRPHIMLGHLRWCIHFKYYFHLCLMILLIILLFIPAVIVYLFELFKNPIDRLQIGRLAIVQEARQKARVVGITDWWTQVLFKPLHDVISDILKRIPEDGTFDQNKPVKLMLSKIKNPRYQTVVSSDLSAATDRLPVALQRDILLVLGLPGNIWEHILNRPYLVSRPFPQLVTYSVGQPMGVLSSFVMLSLTNHFINAIALMSAGQDCTLGLNKYSVLGDDQACSDLSTAEWYSKILGMLGVTVNPIKGFSGSICEFAKRLYFLSNEIYDLSPIGAKVVLQAMNNPMYAVSLLHDCNNKNYTLSNAVSLLSNYLTLLFPRGKTPTQVQVLQSIHLFSLIGPQSGLFDLSKPHEMSKNIFKLDFDRLIDSMGLNTEQVYQFLTDRMIDRWARPTDLQVIAKEFMSELWKISLITDRPISGRLSPFAQAKVLMTTLLASLVAFPITIQKYLKKYFNYLILEFSTRSTVSQMDGTQLNYIKISLSKNPIGPQSFKDLDILDNIDMAMFGRIPFLVSLIPFNIILNRTKTTGTIDQMSAVSSAIALLKALKPEWYKEYVNYLKDLKKGKTDKTVKPNNSCKAVVLFKKGRVIKRRRFLKLP